MFFGAKSWQASRSECRDMLVGMAEDGAGDRRGSWKNTDSTPRGLHETRPFGAVLLWRKTSQTEEGMFGVMQFDLLNS